jgi:zinc finger HIT domain-containing protein 1
MPLVEILPTTNTSHVTPGWAYVADPLYAPSSAAAAAAASAASSSNAKVGRKRGIRGPGAGGGAGGGARARGAHLTARQQTAILRHLAELDRENHRDAQISVPVRKGDSNKDKEKEREAAKGEFYLLLLMRDNDAYVLLNPGERYKLTD